MMTQKNSGISIKLTKESFNIPYLMFTDDYIILCRATKRSIRKFKHIMDHNCQVSGQLVN